VAIRSEATIRAALDARKPGTAGVNQAKQDRSDRAELAVVYRIQQRTHFSRQSTAFASTGELTYY
jgi:hypothetical protein